DIFVVSAAPAPIIPVAIDGALSTLEDTAAAGTLSASDPGGSPLTFSLTSTGALGTAGLTNATTRAASATPSANAHGTDTFTFKVSNGTNDSNVATVTVTIAPVNDAPVAQNGTLAVTAGAPATGTLSATDVDSPSLTYAMVTSGTKGTAAITN